MYAQVIIEYSIKKLDREFTYKVPACYEKIIKPGMKVKVPFGHQVLLGFVLAIFETTPNSPLELKEIMEVVDDKLYLNKELLELGKYLSELTLCSKISAYQTMLPASLKLNKNGHDYAKYDEIVALKDIDKAREYKKNYPRRIAQIKVLEELAIKEELNKNLLAPSIYKTLLEEDLITVKKIPKYRINRQEIKQEKTLTNEQYQVYQQIINSFNTYNTFLLFGVTGSGKTEVYIKVIEDCLKQGKSAIVLVPEISLTAQIAKRFYEAFKNDVAILHSSLSLGEKYDEYLKIYREEVHVVVGTRSAIFAPLKNLGIIIIDEEDASSYKQDNNPRYHARDMAIFRAQYHNIPLVLASATPSLESKARADKGVYKLLTMNNRVNNAKLPLIEIVDMAPEMKKRNLVLSEKLKVKIQEKLTKNEQIILLLNRRGYSTFITCSNCGYTYKCPYCDITLTYHKSSNSLLCHYCGYQKKIDMICPKCHEKALNFYGLGTEKLETNLQNLFPAAKILRMDQDTTRRKGAHEKMIMAFKNGEYNILVGTQMISKGLDFPNVTLVGVINADTTLNIPDYKSSENTFALLSQVAGRSGRSSKNGEVIIQTFNPDHYVINCVKENSYNKFYLQEMQYRHKLNYPPYVFLVSLKVIGKDYTTTLNDANKVKTFLTDHLNHNITILGPTTASVFKLKNEYRLQIILKYKKEENLRKALKELEDIFITNKNTRLEIDFNPSNI